MSEHAVSKTVSRGRLRDKVLLAVQIVVGLDFIIGGMLKLFGAQSMLDLFTRIGAGQWLRYLVGFAELAGGIGVLIPALAGLAALGLATLLVLATLTNVLVIDDPPWVPLIWLVIVGIVAWHRWPRTKALFTGTRSTRRTST
ncbi:DoxX family protein [Nonomuraea sp. NPDC049480]|uniref:DoxX family protein n=1 Tax=Nonomuraea sp. NPDC049480 TaxID=3364353 RepID=UPI00378C0C70